MKELIYEWNPPSAISQVELCDETLRDGLQSPSVKEPDVQTACEVLSLMDTLGVTIADIGLPGAGVRVTKNVETLARYMVTQRLKLKAMCAARTVEADILPVAEIQQRTGLQIGAYCFLGTSPIRQAVEDWDLERLLKTAEKAVAFAHAEKLEVAFVTEDTTRSHPDVLKTLFLRVVQMGVKRLVLCDTVGHSTPSGTQALVDWTRNLVGDQIALDWHGHNDRGLGLINAIAAAEAGCERVHGTCLGVGERVGNTPIDQLMVNLKLMGRYDSDLRRLNEYAMLTAKACGIQIPYNYPVFGKDAFRTATGVHAAAVIKAQNKGYPEWADLVYSSVPAREFGQDQVIEIGPMSGLSNVLYWLKHNQIEATDDQVARIFELAKNSREILKESDIRGCLV